MNLVVIDHYGERPVCAVCRKASRQYGVPVPPGRVFVCDPCLSRVPVVRPERRRRHA